MKTESVGRELSRLQSECDPLQYVVLGGNAGDALIDLGFFQLARDMGISYEIVPLDSISRDRPVVISGGGGLVDEWSDQGTRAVIESLQGSVPALVILPQTVRGNADLLRRLGSNVTIFTRELESFEHVRAQATAGARVLLDHDMALNLDARKFLAMNPAKLPSISTGKDVVRLGLFVVASLRGRMFGSVVVRRRDAERKSQRRPVRVYNDLSFVCAFRGKDERTITNTGSMLLSLIDKYENVSTDRLHVGIGAFLLGKNVQFVDNSNSKIRGVYDYSLKHSSRVKFSRNARRAQ